MTLIQMIEQAATHPQGFVSVPLYPQFYHEGFSAADAIVVELEKNPFIRLKLHEKKISVSNQNLDSVVRVELDEKAPHYSFNLLSMLYLPGEDIKAELLELKTFLESIADIMSKFAASQVSAIYSSNAHHGLALVNFREAKEMGLSNEVIKIHNQIASSKVLTAHTSQVCNALKSSMPPHSWLTVPAEVLFPEGLTPFRLFLEQQRAA